MQPNAPHLWQRFDQYETAVTLLVQDILNPGDTFFDAGANIGGISLSASRSVGPFGKVIAFEVSERVIPQMMANLQHWHASNVFVMQYAVWNKSGDVIPLYFGGAHFADSVVDIENNNEPDAYVETIALDDVVSEFSQAPSLVKFDIEGAEQDALKGFVKTIKKHGPTCILEMSISDTSLTKWVRDAGYKMYRCDTYEPFELDLASRQIVNVLCVHETKSDLLQYFDNIKMVAVDEAGPEDWQEDQDSPFLSFPKLGSGRYLFKIDFSDGAHIDNSTVELSLVAGEPWIPLTTHASKLAHLSANYSTMPFHLFHDRTVVFRAKSLEPQSRFKKANMGLDHAKLLFSKVKITKIETSGKKAPPWEQRKFRI